MVVLCIRYWDDVYFSCLLLHIGSVIFLYLPIDLGLKILEQLFKELRELYFSWKGLDLCIRTFF